MEPQSRAALLSPSLIIHCDFFCFVLLLSGCDEKFPLENFYTLAPYELVLGIIYSVCCLTRMACTGTTVQATSFVASSIPIRERELN